MNQDASQNNVQSQAVNQANSQVVNPNEAQKQDIGQVASQGTEQAKDLSNAPVPSDKVNDYTNKNKSCQWETNKNNIRQLFIDC